MYIFEFILLFLSFIYLLVGVLIRVAFIVLFERRILGYIQIRKGPNKVGYMGIFQSFGDAIRLFIREQIIPLNTNLYIYYFSPVLSLFVMILLWVIMPFIFSIVSFNFTGLFFFCCTRFGVYTLMGRGWSSNRRYALLGATRGVAQTISYEVRMALIFLSFVFFIWSLKIIDFIINQLYIWFVILFYPLFLCWLTSILAETNRTPFDFAEGESELVSGFNIEYGRGGFALLFLAEYGRIIFIRFLVYLLFMGAGLRVFFIRLVGRFFCYWYIWVRGTIPRFRYDKLMYLAWKRFLPISLNFLIFYVFFGLI